MSWFGTLGERMGAGKAPNSENPSRMVQKHHDQLQIRKYKQRLKKTNKTYTKEEIEEFKRKRGIGNGESIKEE